MELKEERNSGLLPWLAVAGLATLAGVWLWRRRQHLPNLMEDLVDIADKSIKNLEEQFGERIVAAS